jgi:hypothetical protein
MKKVTKKSSQKKASALRQNSRPAFLAGLSPLFVPTFQQKGFLKILGLFTHKSGNGADWNLFAW